MSIADFGVQILVSEVAQFVGSVRKVSGVPGRRGQLLKCIVNRHESNLVVTNKLDHQQKVICLNHLKTLLRHLRVLRQKVALNMP